jgi:death on curing protein
MDTEPIFLTLVEVLEIHKNQIENYGGQEGIRDISLLTSALAMPESTFHGQYLHNDLYEMAAAYTYHICMNHPFIDGNKRTAMVAALVFLDFNGIYLDDPEGILYKTMIGVASGKKKKEHLASIFKELDTGE